MNHPDMDHSELEHLQDQLKEPIIKPDDADYDQARGIWNGLFEKHPAAIVRCADAYEVVETLNFVRDQKLPFSVKSGGHDYAGKSVCDNGLVIDLSRMDSIRINPEQKTGAAGPGVTWREFDKKTQEYRLATTGATVSEVGIAGYTLGGGTGYLARKHGLALDNLIAAEVVTASGGLLRADEKENADLFWAIRGGGGNFGIVTSFEYRLHEVGPEIMAGQIVHAIDDAGDVLRFYRDFMKDAPDEMTCFAFFLNIPPVDAFPEQYHGKSAMSLVVGHAGSTESAGEDLQPLLHYGDPILTAVHPMPYTEAQRMFDAGMAKGNRWYSKAHFLDSLADGAIKTLLQFTRSIPGPFSVCYLEPLGGAVNRVDVPATAFPHRNAAYSFHIFPGWADPSSDDELMGWAKEFYDSMVPYSNGGVYVNLLGQDEQARTPKAYGENYSKLTRIKKKYDPDNLFSHNHNIKPDG